MKKFTDRYEPIKAFWERYTKMVATGRTIINFYGAGGVGKTALLKEIENKIKHRAELTGQEIKYISYDFTMGTDLRDVLKTLKFQLAAYDCEFPFFDSGNYYYSLKVGQDATPLKAKSMIKEIYWIKKINRSLRTADNAVYRTYPFIRMARGFLEVADGIFQATAVPRAITTFFSIIDDFLRYYMEQNKFVDGNHTDARNHLNDLRERKNPLELYEFLPALFALDVADWLEKTGNKLIIFFDNYESLISETTAPTTEQLKRDLWLRGGDGLIYKIPNTLWTIAGRNKLHWKGKLAEEVNSHLIKTLSPIYANQFLKRAGIDNEDLRGGLIRLTDGYPIFLDLCVDFYVEYKNQYNDEPTIDEFGEEREEVIGRIFRYIDRAGDDAAKDMLTFLCVLNVWTDEIAFDSGGKALPNFSYNTYKRVKIFSFIQSERIKNEDIDLTVYRFDKTIQSILIATCDKFLVDRIKTTVTEYFEKFFADKKILDAREIFYLKLWAEFIVRFADNAKKISEPYKKFFADKIATFTNNADFDVAEKILKLLMNRLESLNATDTTAYTYFEMDLGWLRRTQGKYSEALDLFRSACDKRTRFLGEKNIETVKAMHKWAISLNDLGLYNDAVTLQKEVLDLRKKIPGDEYPDIVVVKSNLAVTLDNLGRHDEAVTLHKEALALSTKKFGKKNINTLNVKNNLAISYNKLGRYEDAETLQREVLTLRKEILGAEHVDTISAMNNLAISLSGLGRRTEVLELRKKFFAEVLNLRKQALNLSKKVLGDEHPTTVTAMNNLAISFNNLGHCGAAMTLQKKILTLRKKILGDEHPDTVDAMSNLAVYLSALGRHDEVAALQEQILTLNRKKFGDEHQNTLNAMKNLAKTLSRLNRNDEVAALQEEILTVTENNFNNEDQNTLDAMKNLATTLNKLNRNDEAATLREEILTVTGNKFGDEHKNTLDAMNNLAWTLTTLNRHTEALELMETALPLYKKILGDGHPDTLCAADTMAQALNGLGRHEEAIALLRDTLNRCREIFGDNHSLTVMFSKNLAESLAKYQS